MTDETGPAMQAAVQSWLESGAAFSGQAPRRIATHGNMIFLTPTHAYKLKRAVDFGWMDFSSLEKRAEACRQELELNRRTAPEIYCRVLAVTEEADGFALDGSGRPVEWLVEMQRFDEAQRLDHVLDRGALAPGNMRDLADAIAAFHGAAERAAPRDFAATLEAIAQDNAIDMGRAADLFPEADRTALRDSTLRELDRHRDLIGARVAAGWLRRCHGDLHLANIVLWKGRPTPFDCIEFNEDFIAIDPLYDLAFLLMDLEQRGRRDLANLVLNRWLAMVPEPAWQLAGLALLPLFLSIRAGVRAKISGMQWLEAAGALRSQRAAEARRYVKHAQAFLQPVPVELVAVGGLSGSGKSTLAVDLAVGLGPAPGAVLLRSDVLRKRLHGIAPEERLPPAAYSEAENRRMADALVKQCEAALRAGRSVVLDAVNADPQLRGQLDDLAGGLGCPFTKLWLEAPLAVLQARVSDRQGDASDATAEIVERQSTSIVPPTDWQRIDASGAASETLATAHKLVRQTSR
ncbi:MAG: AAA family ATPase [Kiloniellales bacterium]